MAAITVLQHAAQVAGVWPTGTTRAPGSAMRQAGVIDDGAVVLRDDVIDWVGPTAQLPTQPADATFLDLSGQTIVPGFVDSHTHLIFAGVRADEFEQRLGGLTYQQIAERGGGIMSTVRAVRRCSKDELKALARPRLQRMLSFGVTTVEVKTGYGLSLPDEMKCLETIAELNAEEIVDLVPTFLGAHAVPAEYRSDREGYLHLLCEIMLPEVARSGLAEFCDVFCETGVFDCAESQRILSRAHDLGLRLKLHADELTPLGGAELAVQLGAVSADHLLCVTETGVERLAHSDTVATLLPGTAFFLGLDYAPARRLIDGGATVALASDCNPGTCPTENLPLVGTMACTQMGLLPAEALTGLTLNAAAAVGRGDRLGSITPGKQADLVVCSVPDYRQIFYHFGVSHVRRIFKRGRAVFSI